jgi:hypothetical protein
MRECDALEEAKRLMPGREVWAGTENTPNGVVYMLGFVTNRYSPSFRVVWHTGISWEDAASGETTRRIAATAKYGRKPR